ncbi:DNA alkylation repair protein [Pseudarthrobacter sp. J64]|uniref:DNA alkylation repair protein n=1 Tax=Pseudarthrobacter sp. J64 TaxID=3116485 RepID=UPI002E81CEBB|nr:DNA alkylation repair protein [Pseudarthrobacter sp. J64]MEE2568722.1 DNA alkylation repair protein [Pseudarthrobacter sp. J64]
MNELINKDNVRKLAATLAAAGPLPAPAWDRVAAAGEGLDDLSLRARTDRVAAAIVDVLQEPTNPTPGIATAAPEAGYPTAARIFREALTRSGDDSGPSAPGSTEPELTGWVIWPVSEAAVTLALESGRTEDFDDCMALLAELTHRLTCEFAIRRLLAARPDRALSLILDWTKSPDEHVRRLASEGTRPYLPWAIRVPAFTGSSHTGPPPTLPLLDELYRDPSEYVRRSVANHLNDLARHAPDAVVEAAGRWLSAPGGPDASTIRLVRHGLRTLIKKVHPGALALMGFTPASVVLSGPRLERAQLSMPDELRFDVEITNTGTVDALLAVDYVVHYLKANGSHSGKVFKLASLSLGPGETRRLSKGHAFRQMTTRVHHPGTHVLELQVNGQRHGRAEFTLLG